MNSVKEWLPPVLDQTLRRLFRKNNQFIMPSGASWSEAATRCTGYDAEHILAKTLDAAIRVKRGEAAYERDSVLFREIGYNWPLTTASLLAAASSGGHLNVLDFGGSLGSTYFQNRAFLKRLADLRWNVVEQPHYVRAAKKNGIQEHPLYFYDSIDECTAENAVNLVMLSSVLQYLPEPERILEELVCAGADWLIIDRTPFSDSSDHRLFIQKVPERIYQASYPMWVLSEWKIRSLLENHFCLISAFESPEGIVSKAGSRFGFKGMIWEARR